MAAVVFGLIVWAGIGGLVGYSIGNDKGRGNEGAWLGFLLGPIGWIVVAVMEPADRVRAQRAVEAADAVASAMPSEPTRTCRWCAERIKAAAIVCRFCGRDLEPLSDDEIAELHRPRAQAEGQGPVFPEPGCYVPPDRNDAMWWDGEKWSSRVWCVTCRRYVPAKATPTHQRKNHEIVSAS